MSQYFEVSGPHIQVFDYAKPRRPVSIGEVERHEVKHVDSNTSNLLSAGTCSDLTMSTYKCAVPYSTRHDRVSCKLQVPEDPGTQENEAYRQQCDDRCWRLVSSTQALTATKSTFGGGAQSERREDASERESHQKQAYSVYVLSVSKGSMASPRFACRARSRFNLLQRIL
jgi:hypothetical protein